MRNIGNKISAAQAAERARKEGVPHERNDAPQIHKDPQSPPTMTAPADGIASYQLASLSERDADLFTDHLLSLLDIADTAPLPVSFLPEVQPEDV